MANQKNTNETPKNLKTDSVTEDGTVEVLYQRMGDRWFAFSLVGNDVYVGSIAPETIHADVSNEIPK